MSTIPNWTSPYTTVKVGEISKAHVEDLKGHQLTVNGARPRTDRARYPQMDEK